MSGILEYSSTPASNVTVNGIGIAGSNTIKNGDDALRQLMADSASAITRVVDKAVGSYTAAKTDHMQLWRATGAVTVNLTAAATLTSGWALWVKANGGAITVDPAGAETINGAATLALSDGFSAFIVCTGTAFHAVVSGTAEAILTNPMITGTINGGPLGSFRNKIINGDFNIWQRATSQTGNGYGSDDRWRNDNIGSTKTHTQQPFALGQTDVPGNPKYYSRTVVTSVAGVDNYCLKLQFIEGVNALAGKTVTVTFYAKADAVKNIAMEMYQDFGTGGAPSPVVAFIGTQLFALTATWQKFSVTVAIPSVAGKTLGTNGDDKLALRFWFDAGSNFNANTASLGQQSGTFDIAHVSLVEGDARSETDSFSPRHAQQELALCQRYYYAASPAGASYPFRAKNFSAAAAGVGLGAPHPVRMRTAPTKTIAWEINDVAQGSPPGVIWAANAYHWELIHGIASGADLDVTSITMDAEL